MPQSQRTATSRPTIGPVTTSRPYRVPTFTKVFLGLGISVLSTYSARRHLRRDGMQFNVLVQSCLRNLKLNRTELPAFLGFRENIPMPSCGQDRGIEREGATSCRPEQIAAALRKRCGLLRVLIPFPAEGDISCPAFADPNRERASGFHYPRLPVVHVGRRDLVGNRSRSVDGTIRDVQPANVSIVPASQNPAI